VLFLLFFVFVAAVISGGRYSIHTDERFNLLFNVVNAVSRSGEITKQNAHKYVPALDIQSLINIFGLMRKRKTIQGQIRT